MPDNDGSEAQRSTLLSSRLRLAIGPVVLLLILLAIDRGALLESLRGARLAPLLLAGAVVLPPIALRALRWKCLLGPLVGRARYAELLRVYAAGIFLGTVTPGRVGEFVRVTEVPHLEGSRAGYAGALASVLLDRLFDVAVLFALAVFALGVLLPGETGLGWVAGTGLAAGLLLWAGWQLVSASRLAALRARIAGLLPERARAGALERTGEFADAVRSLSAGRALAALVLTLLAWAIGYAANWLTSQSLGLGIGYLEIAGISALCSLAAMLPISVLGAGTRDAVLILILAGYGRSPAEAVAFSVLLLALTLWSGLISGVALLFRRAGAGA